MAGRKRKHSKINLVYKLQINKFIKVYDTDYTSGPEPRSGHRIVCNERAMYAVGGYNPAYYLNRSVNYIVNDEILFHELWRFDFCSKSWTKLETENMPLELASFATVLCGNLLFLYGGTGLPFGTEINEDVYTCKLHFAETKFIFNKVPIENDMKKPLKQYGQSIAIVGSYLYTVGGTDGFSYSMDVYRLNIKTRTWEKLSDQLSNFCNPMPRYRHEIIHYNNYLYVLGGGSSRASFTLKDIPAFNLKTCCWEIFQTTGDGSLQDTFPANRRCHGCIQDPYNDAVILINGGFNENGAFNDTWKLDLRTLQWTCLKTMSLPYGIYFHSASVTPDGKMIIFGGITNRAVPPRRTSDVFAAWITIPKLKDACWDAILFYIQNGIIIVPDDLKILGLPLEYESRLVFSLVR